MWQKAETVPVIKDVMEIVNDTCTKHTEHEYHYTDADLHVVVFNAHQPPKVGDFIIRESAVDIYLCPKQVFDHKYKLIK